MKKTFFAVVASALLFAFGTASAQQTDVYKDTTGKVFSLSDARQITYNPSAGSITVIRQAGGSSYDYLKDNGTVFAKIKTDHPNWLTLGANTLYVPAKAVYIICGSAGSSMSWANAGTEDLNDGCVVYQQALTKTAN